MVGNGTAWRNVGRGGEDFRRGIRSNPGQKEQDRERKTEEKSSTPRPASWGGGSLRAFRQAKILDKGLKRKCPYDG